MVTKHKCTCNRDPISGNLITTKREHFGVNDSIIDEPKFWRGAPWILLEETSRYLSQPGCYEFAIGDYHGPHYVVYIGETTDLNQRMKSHRHSSSGTKKEKIIEYQSKSWVIWVRARHIVGGTKDDVKLYESKFLSYYDYAWNIKENGKNTTREICMADHDHIKQHGTKVCKGERSKKKCHFKVKDADDGKPVRIYYANCGRYRWACGCQGKLKHRGNCQVYPNRQFMEGEFVEDVIC
eukprot:TRINITY_DN4076_c0_g1_i1.p1 TRINITY_DN4076_c0_g1~~TRINITY_DN4076_c0_g1_i1.p1  ORF type:complete len:238 (-),score=34.26 TRINITY_DN4076_c0_g1_i1:5-718(-)